MFKGRFQQTKKNQKRKFENKMSSCTFYTHLWCNGSIWLSKSFGMGSNPVRCANGDVAQLVEHLIEDQGVSGSIPLITTSVKGLGDGLML